MIGGACSCVFFCSVARLLGVLEKGGEQEVVVDSECVFSFFLCFSQECELLYFCERMNRSLSASGWATNNKMNYRCLNFPNDSKVRGCVYAQGRGFSTHSFSADQAGIEACAREVDS